MKKLQLALLITAVISTGCVENIKKIKTDIEKDRVEILQRHEKAGGLPSIPTKVTVVKSVNKNWIGVSEIKSKESINPRLLRKFTVNRTFYSLQDAAERVTSLSSIPVHVAFDARNDSEGGGLDMPQTSPGSEFSVLGGSGYYDATYTGTLAGFLDSLTSFYGVSWEYVNGGVSIYKYKTKSFILQAIAGDISQISEVSQSSGDKSISTKIDIQGMNVWKDIEKVVETMLSENGKVVASPSIGTLTVSDTPRVLDRIEDFINQQNKHLTKQVSVEVKVMMVDMNSSDNYGLNWSVVNENLKSALGITFESGSPLSLGAAALTLSKYATGTVLESGQTVASNSNWQGTSAFVEALSTQGDVTVVTTATAITLNNQPVPIHVGKTTTYLAESSTQPSVTPGEAGVTTLTPGEVTTGFTLNILPHIQDNETLLLQYAIDLSSMELFKVESNGVMIQAPEVDMRRMLQRVRMQSGETLVIAGFEGVSREAFSSGVGNPDRTWAGGKKTGTETRKVMVVLVTPVISGG